MAMSMSGDMPGPKGETQTADGQDMGAPMDMAGCCEQAASAAHAHSQQEAGKVGMA